MKPVLSNVVQKVQRFWFESVLVSCNFTFKGQKPVTEYLLSKVNQCIESYN